MSGDPEILDFLADRMKTIDIEDAIKNLQN